MMRCNNSWHQVYGKVYGKAQLAEKASEPAKPPKPPLRDLCMDLWRPRAKWADSRSFYDTIEVKLKRFEVSLFEANRTAPCKHHAVYIITGHRAACYTQ